MGMIEQFIRFLLSGGIAAVVDLFGYNGVLCFLGRDRRVLASMISVTFAMSASFLLNRNWVFAEANGASLPVVEFVAVTLTAAYGLQSIVIWLLSAEVREWGTERSGSNRVSPFVISLPAREVRRLAWGLVGGGEAGRGVSVDFVERNLVKGIALGVALVWNFSWYRWYVFA